MYYGLATSPFPDLQGSFLCLCCLGGLLDSKKNVASLSLLKQRSLSSSANRRHSSCSAWGPSISCLRSRSNNKLHSQIIDNTLCFSKNLYIPFQIISVSDKALQTHVAFRSTEQSCDAKKQSLVYCCWKEITLNLLSSHLTELLIPVAHTVKNLPAVQESWVSPLGQEDPLEKRMASHSIILAQRIPWTEEPSGLQSVGS